MSDTFSIVVDADQVALVLRGLRMLRVANPRDEELQMLLEMWEAMPTQNAPDLAHDMTA
jgi:hypothetical protein